MRTKTFNFWRRLNVCSLLRLFSVLFFFGLSMLLYLVWMFRFKPSSARYPVAIYGVCSISNLKVFSCFLVLRRRTKLFHESVYSQWIFLCFLFFFRSIFLDFLLVTIRVFVFFSSVFRLYILCLSCLVGSWEFQTHHPRTKCTRWQRLSVCVQY